MGLFGKKDKPLPATYRPEAPPSVSPADLSDAARLMDRWDAVLGNSDATWDCLEAIARRGGFKGAHASLMETMDGKAAGDVTQRPWRWWNEAARVAQTSGDDALAGRIFLFTQLFKTQIAANMRIGDMMDTGLEPPAAETYRSIAEIAVGSLARLSPDLLIHDSATGKVDVANALRMAEGVSGVTAPRTAAPAPAQRTPSQDYPSPFNKL